MATLWDIDANLETLEATLENMVDGSGSDELVELLLTELDTTREERDRKLENYARYIQHLEALAQATEVEKERLAQLATTRRNQAKRLKESLKFYFQQKGIKKVDTPTAMISLAQNGGKQPIQVELEDLPKDYTYPVFKADMERIRADLEQGVSVPGAQLLPREAHIRIK